MLFSRFICSSGLWWSSSPDMSTRSAKIADVLRAYAALELVEGIHAGGLSSFAVDACVESNSLRSPYADAIRAHDEVVAVAFGRGIGEVDAERRAARIQLPPLRAVMDANCIAYNAAHDRFFYITRLLSDDEFSEVLRATCIFATVKSTLPPSCAHLSSNVATPLGLSVRCRKLQSRMVVVILSQSIKSCFVLCPFPV